MIIRLSQDEIIRVWDHVRPGIFATLAPTGEKRTETIQRVLRSLLCGDMELWLALEDPNDFSEKSIYGAFTTVIYKEPISESKSLLIYSLFETRSVPPAIWAIGLKKLRDYASVQGCFSLSAYSNIPKIIEMCEAMGFRPATYLIKEV